MTILASALDNIGIADAAIVAILGYAVVFFGLILLMCVIMIMGRFFIGKEKKAAAKADAHAASGTGSAAPETTETPEAEPVYAPGSAGSLKLYNVEPRTAAMIMAIVADKMGKPLNELRFISIKEVESK